MTDQHQEFDQLKTPHQAKVEQLELTYTIILRRIVKIWSSKSACVTTKSNKRGSSILRQRLTRDQYSMTGRLILTVENKSKTIVLDSPYVKKGLTFIEICPPPPNSFEYTCFVLIGVGSIVVKGWVVSKISSGGRCTAQPPVFIIFGVVEGEAGQYNRFYLQSHCLHCLKMISLKRQFANKIVFYS